MYHSKKLIGSNKLQVSCAKEPYKTDNFLQKRHANHFPYMYNVNENRENMSHCILPIGSNELQVSFVKEPYKRDNIPQKRPVI